MNEIAGNKSDAYVIKYYIPLFFILHLVYFEVFNRYHLFYLEQTILFRYDFTYLLDSILRPGGLSDYAGLFLTQFFNFPFAGSLIVTFTSFLVFVLSLSILRTLKVNNPLWALIPVIILAALQSDYIYKPGYTAGLILVLTSLRVYIDLPDKKRCITGFAGLFILYFSSGGFSLIFLLYAISYEIIIRSKKEGMLIALSYIALFFISKYIINILFVLPPGFDWLNPLIAIANPATRYWLAALILVFPGFLIAVKISRFAAWREITAKIPGNNSVLISFSAGIIMVPLLFRYSYDHKTEVLLKIDHHVQKGEWEKVLAESAEIPGNNPIVSCLTNLALYKSGQMGDKLFHYYQSGSTGLWLPWGEDSSPFFGNIVFYHLGYLNEAYHWAFEALVTKGESPRTLQMLAKTSLINMEYELSEKYLGILNKTLFYKKWAGKYLAMIEDTLLIRSEREIIEKRMMLVHKDFFSNVNDHKSELRHLLSNNKQNKMAYEYLNSAHLLDKELDLFLLNLAAIDSMGYNRLPDHYGEAIMAVGNTASMSSFKLPDDFKVSQRIAAGFAEYLNSQPVNSKSGIDRLQNKFGKTYWYYLQFR